MPCSMVRRLSEGVRQQFSAGAVVDITPVRQQLLAGVTSAPAFLNAFPMLAGSYSLLEGKR